MSNTHRLEKLRLVEAPDNTGVWVKKLGYDWFLSDCVKWLPENKYVIDDGFFVEERKAFAEGKTVQYKLIDRDYWTEVDKDHKWDKHFQYRVKPKEWYELEENIGKLIMISDSLTDTDIAVKEFVKYIAGDKYPFRTTTGKMYRYARLILPEELAKGEDNGGR